MICSQGAANMHMAVVLLQEYHELVSTFKRQEALLYQFSEEKVQLAQHALELITQYQKQLDEVRPTGIGMLCQKVIQAATVAWTAYCTELHHCTELHQAPVQSPTQNWQCITRIAVRPFQRTSTTLCLQLQAAAPVVAMGMGHNDSRSLSARLAAAVIHHWLIAAGTS